MGGENLVFGKDAVDRASQTGSLALCGDISEDVVDSKVGTHALADLPVLHGFAHGNDLAGHVGAGHRILLLGEWELALCDEKVAVLADRFEN